MRWRRSWGGGLRLSLELLDCLGGHLTKTGRDFLIKIWGQIERL